MKNIYLSALLSILCFAAHSQTINTGGFHANFGVDADTRAGNSKYGPPATSPSGDDWFTAFGNSGKEVIDTSNAANYKWQLQANKNISFSQRMSQPLYSKVNGKLWLDAVYMRDFVSNPGKDSTSFYNGRNGDNPASWGCGAKDLNEDNDIVDAFVHLRRNGITAQDSLWLFAAVSTIGKSNDRYVDIELYNKNLSYNRGTGKFSTPGTAYGHTQWLFDPLGNIIQTGDVLITVVYISGQKPKVDIHLWVSRITRSLINPAQFNFGNMFHTNNAWALYGYANIVPNNSTTVTGSGIMNSSSNASKDTTFSAPWGTTKSSLTWAQNYQSKQFVEIGLNLTRIGIDPSSYLLTASQSCDRLYQSVIFKSGNYTYSSDDGGHGGGDDEGEDEGDYADCHDNTERVDLEDFVGPIAFQSPNAPINFTVTTDTLTCDKPIGTLAISNPSSESVYTWSTFDGKIVGSNPDSSVITVKKRGNYRLTARIAAGCPAFRTENLYVITDSVAPIATADIGLTPSGDIQLLGGDTLLSRILTPCGGSHGFIWEWKGPNDFTANTQNPMINADWAWGAYYLTLKEARNGCKAMASLDVSFRAREQMNLEKDISNNGSGKTYLWRNTSADKLWLVTTQPANANGTVIIYNAAGQLLSKKNVQFEQGQNNIELSLKSTKQVIIISVYVGQQLSYTRKVQF